MSKENILDSFKDLKTPRQGVYRRCLMNMGSSFAMITQIDVLLWGRLRQNPVF